MKELGGMLHLSVVVKGVVQPADEIKELQG